MRKNQRNRLPWRRGSKFSHLCIFLCLLVVFASASAYAVTIVISYTEGEVPADREPRLTIYYKDKTTGTWVVAQNQERNEQDNYVKADIPEFGLETILAAFPPPPDAWSLLSAPNPCSGQAFIRYDVVTSSQITIDLSGGVLLDQFKEAGRYQMSFDCGGLGNGFYFLTMRSNGTAVASRKVAVVH